MTKRSTILLLAVLLLALPLAPAEAEAVSLTVPFELDKWVDLGTEDGPITLHRFRVRRQTGRITKSTLFRPGNSEYLASIELQLEYTNSASRDFKAVLGIEWTDEEGRVIDGYNGGEDLDEDERHELVTVKLSTLKYGLEVAEKLKIGVAVR